MTTHCSCWWDRTTPGLTAGDAARTLKSCALHAVWRDQQLAELKSANAILREGIHARVAELADMTTDRDWYERQAEAIGRDLTAAQSRIAALGALLDRITAPLAADIDDDPTTQLGGAREDVDAWLKERGRS